jgi:proline iminopeptidase
MITTKTSITAEDLFYPKSEPYDKGYLDVGDGHQVFYQQIGNPDGVPVLLVHGGPGGGIEAGDRTTRIHDPHYFRISAVDQRGCGQSKPHVAKDTANALRHNTTDKLSDDFEKIRIHLKIPAWNVYGGSWGACLATYYAANHPEHILSLTINSIWMHTPDEIDWYINRMGLFMPEAEATLLSLLPSSVKRFDRLNYLYKSITGKDKKHALKIAEAQGNFEFLATHFHAPETLTATTDKMSRAEKIQFQKMMISLGALEIFYMKENPLPANWYKTSKVKKALKSIKDIALIQGRYDIVCPPTTAYDFYKAHPHSTLTMVQYAGHKSSEPELLQALLKANARLMK